MKTKFSLLTLFAVSLLAAQLSRAQGVIVANGIVTNLFPGEIDLNWPGQTTINGFGFSPVGRTYGVYSNVFAFWEPVTVGVRVFLVSSNQPISLAAIRSSSYTEISDSANPALPANPTNIINVNVPFLVGLYSGANFTQYYPPGNTIPVEYSDPVFGWAKLENINGSIQLLTGALEYKGGGIYAGTQNIIPIPEPDDLVLLALCGGILAYVRRRK